MVLFRAGDAARGVYEEHILNGNGFMLIELIMVIVILGILAAVAAPRFLDL